MNKAMSSSGKGFARIGLSPPNHLPHDVRDSLMKRESRVARLSWCVALTSVMVVGVYTIGWALALLSAGVLLISKFLTASTVEPFNPRRMTILSFWYVTYLMMIFIPAFFVYHDQVGPYRSAFLFAVESVLITVPVGWIVASKLLKFSRRETEVFFQKPICLARNPARYFIGFCVLSATCLLFLILYIRAAPVLPILFLFSESGNSRVLALFREESFKLLDSPLTYIFYSVQTYVLPFATLISIGSYLISKRRKWLYTILITLSAGLFFASVTLAKAPVAAIFLVIGFLFYFYRSGAVSYKAIVLCLVLVVVFPIAVVLIAYAGQGLSVSELLLGLADRLFYKPAEVVYYYFEVFPSHVGYAHGRSIGMLSRLLGWKYFDTPNYVGVYGFLGGIDTVSANGAFIGNLNADFGPWGVIVGGVVAGWIMQSIHIYLVRRDKTIPCLACYSLIVLAFWSLQSTALPVVLASDGVLPLVLILFLFERWINNKRAILSPLGREPSALQLRRQLPS